MSDLDGTTRRVLLQRTATYGLLATGAGTLLAACGDSSNSGASTGGGKKEIAFSHVNSDAPLVTGIRQFMNMRAAQLGYKMLHDNTTQSNVQQQLSALDTWMAQGVPAICFFPAEQAALKPFIAQANAADIVLTTYLFKMPDTDGAIVFPPAESGRLAGEDAVKWIKANGDDQKILLLTWTPLPDVAPRWEIPKQMIESQTNAKIVATQDALAPDKGLEVTESALQANPDIDMVVAAVDDAGVGALRAFENAKKDPRTSYISGQDGALDALKAIQARTAYKASVALSMKDIGYGIVDLNAGLLEGKLKSPHDMKIPSVLATLETADGRRNLQRLLDEWAILDKK